MQKKVAPRRASGNEIKRLIAEQATDRSSGDIAKTSAIESLRAKKKERDQNRDKYRLEKSRAKRARVPRRPDPERLGRFIIDIPFAGPDSIPVAETPEGQHVVPDQFHVTRVRQLREFLQARASPDDAGLVPRWVLTRVRAAYREIFGPAVAAHLEKDWRPGFRGAFVNALRSRLGDARMADLTREGVAGGSGGATIIPWLNKKFRGVPAALTPERVDKALNSATLALRGGGKKRNWEIVVRELILEMDNEQTRTKK